MKETKEKTIKQSEIGLKGNEGITLIALIITIIVMLILVTVSITAVINGGLFNKAGKAKKDTDNAVEAEQRLASGMVNIRRTRS